VVRESPRDPANTRRPTLRRVAVAAPKPANGQRDTPLLPPARHRPTGRSRATLLVLTGTNAGQLAVVGRGGVVIGRGTGADLVLDDLAVSSRHARVAIGADGGYTVEDLDSTNGTFVGGRRVGTSSLVAGDALQLGPEVVLRFSLSHETDDSLQRRLYESSVRDPLTCTFNRAYFADRLMVELAVAHRSEEDTSLLMIDLDGLKEVNDRHGHLSGDRALSFVAARIASTTRAGDLVARYGGDEFVVLAGRTSRADALLLAERVREAIAGLCIGAGGQRVVVTVSVGVASLSELGPDAQQGESLVALADERLYEAKRAGRNRVRPETVAWQT